MTQPTNVCRLCINICTQFKVLCDESGSCNEVYETTVKYFDPMILSLEQVKCPAICLACWGHINDFHSFQLEVTLAQAKLAEYIEPIETIVKIEIDNVCSPIEDSCSKLEKVPPSDGTFPQETDAVITEDEDRLHEDFKADYFSSDDDKPLVDMKSGSNVKARQTPTYEIGTKKEDLPKKRGRKLKLVTEKGARHRNRKTITKSNKCEALSNIDTGKEHSSSTQGKLISAKIEISSTRTSKEIDDFIAQWKQDLECYVCGDTSKSMHLLRQHFRADHNNSKCYVLCCQRKLSRRHQLEEHIRLHVDPSAFKCEICGKCCTNKRTLSNHMYEQHTEQGQQRCYECPVCSKRFAKKPVWKRHLEIHETSKDFVCKECGKGFPTEQRRNVHERMVHNSDHVCEQCGKTIHGIYALRQHVLEHAGVKKRKWPCNQCSAQLNTHASLKRHIEVAHHDGSTAYICSDCGKISATAVALRSHKKYVHQAQRKHKCSLCAKAFKTTIGLREHMATHTGEDLYTCPHCPRTFKVNSNMHHHRKKAHPKEWAEARLNKPVMPTIDVNQVTQEVVL